MNSSSEMKHNSKDTCKANLFFKAVKIALEGTHKHVLWVPEGFSMVSEEENNCFWDEGWHFNPQSKVTVLEKFHQTSEKKACY